uniref:Poly(3-hydroxyalkanoate) polymerase subunit PhaE n=1 Tax=Candidatus Kentrum sp. FW TaxID=2126338 RepID=A0A450SHH9_9GAMM|nr:MAG: poly(R)-hydroxyalkanoic acid synthase, class III, PhaE subunit [Candidatus Kentron sp. FW]
MNWSEQTESMMKMWNDAQKQFLGGGWYNLANGMPGLSGMSTMPDLSNLMNWLKPGFMPGFPMGGTGSDGSATGQAMAGNLAITQAMMMQGLGILTRAWQTVAPSLSTGKSWQEDFDVFLRQLGNEFVGTPQRLSTAGMGMKELMGSFLGEWGPLLKPWLASIQGTGLGGPMGDMLMGERFPFGKMFGMGMEPAFRDLAQIPMMGVSREQMAKVTRAFDSHVDLRGATYKYQIAVGKVVGEAMKETIEKLVEVSKKGGQIAGVRELMSIWVKITDRKLTQMYVTDEFTAIQAEMSEASLKAKLAQRAVLEMILVQLDIPTRTELDDAYKTLYNLKKQIKELCAETVDVRNAHKQAEAEMMELRNARKLAESEATKLRDTSNKLEAELSSLHDTMRKMETKFAKDLAKVAESIPEVPPKTSEPATKVSSKPAVSPATKAPESADTKVSPKSVTASSPATETVGNKSGESVKSTKK